MPRFPLIQRHSQYRGLTGWLATRRKLHARSLDSTRLTRHFFPEYERLSLQQAPLVGEISRNESISGFEPVFSEPAEGSVDAPGIPEVVSYQYQTASARPVPTEPEDETRPQTEPSIAQPARVVPTTGVQRLVTRQPPLDSLEREHSIEEPDPDPPGQLQPLAEEADDLEIGTSESGHLEIPAPGFRNPERPPESSRTDAVGDEDTRTFPGVDIAGEQTEYRGIDPNESDSESGDPESLAGTDMPATDSGEPDVLFAPKADDTRSPQAWLDRLRRHSEQGSQSRNTRKQEGSTIGSFRARTRTVTPRSIDRSGARDPDVPVPDPPPLTSATRRFLKPLVGVDPGSVRVHRTATAGEFTFRQGARALAIGDEVMLAEGHQSDSPETLGLLAHELTHVARRRVPGFIPPVIPARIEPPASEETVALEAEERVRRVAEARRSVTGRATFEHREAQPPALELSGAKDTYPDEGVEIDSRAEPATGPGYWGGLPAPWQPMPAWPAELGADKHHSTALDSPGSNGSPMTARPEPPIQRAEQGRSPDRSDSTERTDNRQASHRDEATERVEPDLDVLAQQVYSILRRRLAAERRRSGEER